MFYVREEIIVCVLDYKYESYNTYSEIFVDFRSIHDLRMFQEYTDLRFDGGSIICIRNYSSRKRLIRNGYYALNVQDFKEIESENNQEESFVLAYTFDIQHKDINIFLKHGPLAELEENPNILGSLEDLDFGSEILYSLCVYDVEQANYNEIRDSSDRPILIYDMGTPLHSSRAYVRNVIEQHINSIKKNSPVFVLSHWDIDHYQCLVGMTDDEICSFSSFFFVNKTKSLTSQRTIERILKLMPRKTSVFEVPSKTYKSKYPYTHNILSFSNLDLFIGENSRNINYAGLMLVVKTTNTKALLSGDCCMSQANDILNQYSNIDGCRTIMVVPHHGGKFSTNYNHFQTIGNLAIISVGQNNYGHPSKQTLNLLRNYFPYIRRTDKEGDIVEVLK